MGAAVQAAAGKPPQSPQIAEGGCQGPGRLLSGTCRPSLAALTPFWLVKPPHLYRLLRA
jgi:hypothetical protein